MKTVVVVFGSGIAAMILAWGIGVLFFGDHHYETIMGWMAYAFVAGGLLGGVWRWRRLR